ncbi:MAG: copper amine oxidase N-terminal domain-containing protein [Defluviitaleaceae bacterium]|nr:copper amine oxidase N-terminal domain-containing protein [Defluviitaleaceae bacterium]MCL2262791.1 copper amine oxidase N-terminal domain-containing protein [Defluviitaleaceae bacterium]
MRFLNAATKYVALFTAVVMIFAFVPAYATNNGMAVLEPVAISGTGYLISASSAALAISRAVESAISNPSPVVNFVLDNQHTGVKFSSESLMELADAEGSIRVDGGRFTAVFTHSQIRAWNIPRGNTLVLELFAVLNDGTNSRLLVRRATDTYVTAFNFTSAPIMLETLLDNGQPYTITAHRNGIFGVPPLPPPNPPPYIRIFIDGELVRSDDAHPFIRDGRTMVPVRVIVEGLGGQVEWFEQTRTVRILRGGTDVILQLDEPLPDDMGTPIIENGRTFVPIRHIAETFGAEVAWSAEEQSVSITTL